MREVMVPIRIAMLLCLLLTACGATETAEAPRPEPVQGVTVAQLCLGMMGFYHGPADGVMTAELRQAWDRYMTHRWGRVTPARELALEVMTDDCLQAYEARTRERF